MQTICRRRFWAQLSGCCLTLVSLYLFLPDYEIVIPEFGKINLTKFPDLDITEVEEFPTDGPILIEKIIHQSWKTTDIPYSNLQWIKSWHKNHPDWKYMYWTDESARKVIADKYPRLLPVYDNYPENLRRADALRYVILYEFGGVYADLDMESRVPINNIAMKYSCILTEEPYEHSIIDTNFEHLVSNAFIACRSGHPLMKKLINNLSKFANMYDTLDSTGPHYVTLIYNDYIESIKITQNDDTNVHLVPAEYFLPTIDPDKFYHMKKKCLIPFNSLSYIQQRACLSLKLRGFIRKPYYYSITVHHWQHTYIHTLSYESKTSIFDIVPHAHIYTS